VEAGQSASHQKASHCAETGYDAFSGGTAMTSFTTSEKLKALKRELGFRRRCYPKWIVDGRMTKEEAEHEIAIFAAIHDDYLEKESIDHPSLL